MTVDMAEYPHDEHGPTHPSPAIDESHYEGCPLRTHVDGGWACTCKKAVHMFNVGDKVKKIGGDYRYEGVVVAAFAKVSGEIRYVVEDDRRCLHIFSYKNLSHLKEE